MSIPIIGQSQRPTARFVRTEGYSLQTGVSVAYELAGLSFRVIANRLGVDVSGSFPVVGREGIARLMVVLLRSVRQHEHLKSFPEGTKQQALSEEMLDAEMRAPGGTPTPDKRETVS